MRIVAGNLRGRALTSVGKGDVGAHLRPTTDRVRENIFNMLSGGRYGDPITGARVLDLFAGTGALGLEALSRGAAHVTFIDNGAVAGRLIGENIEKCDVRTATRLLRQNATRPGTCPVDPFGLIFLDPPYGAGLGITALNAVDAGGWLAPDAIIVMEDGAPIPPPSGFQLLDQRKYGSTHIMFIQKEVHQ